jgi:hypothetical protein
MIKNFFNIQTNFVKVNSETGLFQTKRPKPFDLGLIDCQTSLFISYSLPPHDVRPWQQKPYR